MAKRIPVKELQIRFVPVDDPEFAARRVAARNQLIAMLAERLVAQLMAERLHKRAATQQSASEPSDVVAAQAAKRPAKASRSQQADRIVWRAEMPELLNCSAETVRRWVKRGKLPAPDVQLTRRTIGWRLSTLHKAGVNLP